MLFRVFLFMPSCGPQFVPNSCQRILKWSRSMGIQIQFQTDRKDSSPKALQFGIPWGEQVKIICNEQNWVASAFECQVERPDSQPKHRCETWARLRHENDPYGHSGPRNWEKKHEKTLGSSRSRLVSRPIGPAGTACGPGPAPVRHPKSEPIVRRVGPSLHRRRHAT